ncbi:MAG: hypothetical protein HC790_00075 [Acaryochloridaceae cyanobacterium CSU_3_4]|nr:hypothetical protein [Acaryochloridaceae cyanobacterium CSU_3_4]
MAQSLSTILNYEQSYHCPVCRYGQLNPLMLMDAFACSFCRHIFTANLSQQSVCLADTTQSIYWRWTGQRWQPLHHANSELTVAIWILSVGLTVIPTTLIGLIYQIFPPLEDSAGAEFPLLWLVLVFLAHLIITVWILAEFYQIPFYVAWKVRSQA